MFTLTLLALAVAAVLIVASVALLRKLNETEAELERTQQRMARLDKLIDEFASREEETTRERLDSAQLVAVSLGDLDTEDVFDDDFAAPQMTSAPRDESDDDIAMLPARPRLNTPVVTPRNTLPPGSRESILEVGSIQVRSGELREQD